MTKADMQDSRPRGGTGEIRIAGTYQITADEEELLRMWRGTDERGRTLIMHVARGQQGWTEGSTLRVVEGGRSKHEQE